MIIVGSRYIKKTLQVQVKINWYHQLWMVETLSNISLVLTKLKDTDNVIVIRSQNLVKIYFSKA